MTECNMMMYLFGIGLWSSFSAETPADWQTYSELTITKMHIYCIVYLQLVTIHLFTEVNNHNLRTVWHWAVMTDVSWSLNLKGQLYFPPTAICFVKTESERELNNLCMVLFQHFNSFASLTIQKTLVNCGGHWLCNY